MRPVLVLLMWSLVLAMGACGGTSSETPWPVEPESRPLGPSGESSPPVAEVPSAEPEEQPDAGRASRRRRAEPAATPQTPGVDAEP